MTFEPCLIDLSGRSKFRLTGPDRERYLNGQVSNRVSLATSDQVIEACVCNVKGKLEGVVFITRSADGEALLVDAPGELRESLLLRLDRYLIADDCEWEDVSDALSLVHVIGAPPDLPGATWRKANRFGPEGHDLWVMADSLAPVLDAGPRVIDETDDAIEEIRIRHGIPRWGADMTGETLPAEVGLEKRAIDFHKGCYLGQEVISRIQSVGRVNRSLCLVAPISGSEVNMTQGDELFPQESEPDTRQVGEIKSVTTDGRWGLALIRSPWNAPESRLVNRSSEGMIERGILEVRTFESGGE